jgi:hypothetical protein
MTLSQAFKWLLWPSTLDDKFTCLRQPITWSLKVSVLDNRGKKKKKNHRKLVPEFRFFACPPALLLLNLAIYLRSPVLSKTERTFMPTDRRYIERFISEAQSTLNATSSILSKHRMSNNRSPGYPKRKGAGKKESKGSPTVQSGPSHGYVVASGAEPISDQNRGHQMLAAMG